MPNYMKAKKSHGNMTSLSSTFLDNGELDIVTPYLQLIL
jgi:hypothetical protein